MPQAVCEATQKQRSRTKREMNRERNKEKEREREREALKTIANRATCQGQSREVELQQRSWFEKATEKADAEPEAEPMWHF